MSDKKVAKKLNNLLADTPVMELSDKDRVVIFSDVHLGNGGSRDDFAHNGDFFHHILEHYYYTGNYHLVLNGDIEELYKFSLKKIFYRWKELYKLQEKFHRKGKLTRVFGNHDFNLHNKKKFLFNIPLYEALKLKWKENGIFIFHGHQAGLFNRAAHLFSSFVVRYLAQPLGIGNYTVVYDSRRKYRLERRVYEFAKRNKILAIIGHTHRPLFESLSRIDSLKFRIERYCRIYPMAKERKKKELERKIKLYKNELQGLLAKEKNPKERNSLYGMDPMVPCMFNSGCCIGKNGITAIEIRNGTIQLVYWFDRTRSEKYFDFNGYVPKQLGNSDYWRVVFKKETLDYVFSRINLLA